MQPFFSEFLMNLLKIPLTLPNEDHFSIFNLKCV